MTDDVQKAPPLSRDDLMKRMRDADRFVIETRNALGSFDATYIPADALRGALTDDYKAGWNAALEKAANLIQSDDFPPDRDENDYCGCDAKAYTPYQHCRTCEARAILALRDQTPEPASVSDGFEKLRSYGYAPGSYFCFCGECGKQHTADKRAWRCLECAERRILFAIEPAPVTVQEAAKVLLENTPNPIFDQLKPVMLGEFQFKTPYIDENGDECLANINIPWTSIKPIISAALRALAGEQEGVKSPEAPC